MPLLIDSTEIKKVPDDIVAFHHSYEQLVASSLKLKTDGEKIVQADSLIYVCQGEYAVVPPDDEFLSCVGSEDATTCHIMVLRHTGSNVCGLSHLDGCETEKLIIKMTKDVLDISIGGPEGRLEVDLVGGFLDDRQQSIELTREVLGVLLTAPHAYYLRTFSCTDLNDTVIKSVHFPIAYGLGVEVKTGKIFRAKFPDKGPDLDIRSASNFAGCRNVHNIYDSARGLLVIGPYDWGAVENAAHIAQLPDHVIRKHLSTSPAQEPDYFESHVRAAFSLLHAHPQPNETLFKDNAPRLYRKTMAGSWVKVS